MEPVALPPSPDRVLWVEALLRDEHDRVLAMIPPREDRFWCLPGGPWPADHSPADGLRELVWNQLGLEVTGSAVLAVAFERPVLVGHQRAEPGTHLVFDVGRFRAVEVEAMASPREGWTSAWKWADRRDLKDLLHPHHLRRALAALDAGQGAPLIEHPHRRALVTPAGRGRPGAGAASRVGHRAADRPATRTSRACAGAAGG